MHARKNDGHDVGRHPLVTRLLKGAFNTRPPLPKYSSTWDVQVVLNFWTALGSNTDLSLKIISWKTVMLFALTRPSRSADLSKLDIQRRVYISGGVEFQPSGLAKQSRQGKPISSFFYPEGPILCPVQSLREYEQSEQRTAGFCPRLLLPLHSSCLSLSL